MSNKERDKKNKVAAMGITLASIIILVGIGIAFFAASVSNANNERLSTQTATMSLEFDDNDNGVSGTLNLGQSIVKKFTIENTGTVDASGKISWYNLVNTYTANSLSWVLEQSTTENGTYTSIGTGLVPTSTTATTQTLKDRIMVPVNATYYYKLTITLNNLDIDQSSDINASMHSQFSLQEGTPPQLATTTMENLVSGASTSSTNVINAASVSSSCTNTLAYDGTTDNNLRYVGANPCNYVVFNGETPTTGTKWIIINSETGNQIDISQYDNQSDCYDNAAEYGVTYECQSISVTVGGWRIIGVMNNVDDGADNLETRIKLIRNDSLGDYSWDTSDSSINAGDGVNDWTQADLMRELNGDYLDTTLTGNTNWYNGRNNQKTGVFDYRKVLGTEAQSLIEDAKWYLGSIYPSINTSDALHNSERSTVTYSTNNECNDSACPRATEWTGKVALAYPSDNAFAIGGDERTLCLDTRIEYCAFYQWINTRSGWLLSPRSDTSYHAWGFYPYLSNFQVNMDLSVKPTVYLKANVKIIDGDGSPENPFILGF